MLDVVTFKWKAAPGYRSKFESHHVNVLRSMVRRNYQRPHRFSCITDDPKGLDSDIRAIPLWPDHGNLPSAYGPRNPSCYRRLKLFSPEAREIIGPRFVSMDIDMVITGDLSPLWDRLEDFVILKSPMVSPRYFYNGSMMMMTAGARPRVWQDFHPRNSVLETKMRGFFGSDQAWISMKLGQNEATWDESDGVYSFRLHINSTYQHGRFKKRNPQKLPENARVTVWHGEYDPWGKLGQSLSWVQQHWR